MWLVFVFGAHCISYSGVGFALVNIQVALVFGYGNDSCQLRYFVGMLVSLIGGGSGGWVSVPLWCILLPAGVVGFT